MNLMLPLLAVLFWSGNMIVNKLAVGAISPEAISFYRWFLAALILTPFCLPQLLRHWPQVKANWWRLFILGGLGMVMFQCLAYVAAETISATEISVMVALLPVFTLLLGAALFRHKLSTSGVIGSLISLAGVVLLVSKGSPMKLVTHGLVMGDALMLLAVTSYSLYSLLLKQWKMDLPVWVSLYGQVVWAVLLLVPVFLHSQDYQIHGKAWGLIGYAGLLASLAAPYLWMHGVARLGASRATIFMNLIPVFSAILAMLILGERLGEIELLGSAMTICGVLVSQIWSLVGAKEIKVPAGEAC
ncbi:DMT family transporter [Dongshaea marina]|uniref:DMT family transporter n=1 Tax=Dongshaea marina TaxID=2047966 RepID=UPI000D3E479D|nr:DMT family transporter [Dongshaea marina]